MGLELSQCRAVIKGESVTGKLHLDSKELAFRGGDLKWSIKIGKGTSAKVAGEKLTVKRGAKSATFNIGVKADKWAKKVLNPPSRGTKLGLKADMRFLIKGDFEKSFETELLNHGLVAGRGPKSCDVAFIRVRSAKELKTLDKLAVGCAKGVHLWVIWPKGDKEFGQSDVIARGRDLGMGPGKKVSFDETHTAMRFSCK